jgi:hypothetical protein
MAEQQAAARTPDALDAAARADSLALHADILKRRYAALPTGRARCCLS